MRFYKNQHQFYIGIDLHARTMYGCVINNLGETVFHMNMSCSTENLELATNTFGKTKSDKIDSEKNASMLRGASF